MPFGNDLCVPRIEWIAVEKAEVFGVLIDDLVRVRTAYNIAKHTIIGGFGHNDEKFRLQTDDRSDCSRRSAPIERKLIGVSHTKTELSLLGHFIRIHPAV